MQTFLVILVGILSLAGAIAPIFLNVRNRGGVSAGALSKVEQEFVKRENFKTELEGMYENMVDLGSVRRLVQDVKVAQEALKAERGRITIMEAEVETVEQRFRELEEIERELEASSVETKNEYGILKKKEEDLTEANKTLSGQLGALGAEADKILASIKLSPADRESVKNMKADLNEAVSQISLLLAQISGGNEQYLLMKKRYDALDIEYAQLYEKFSVSDEPPEEDE